MVTLSEFYSVGVCWSDQLRYTRVTRCPTRVARCPTRVTRCPTRVAKWWTGRYTR